MRTTSFWVGTPGDAFNEIENLKVKSYRRGSFGADFENGYQEGVLERKLLCFEYKGKM